MRSRFSSWSISFLLVGALITAFAWGNKASAGIGYVDTLTLSQLSAQSPIVINFEDISKNTLSGYWDVQGVKFSSDKGKAIYVNSYNRGGAATASGEYSLANDAISPYTSVNDPLRITFKSGVKAVGFYYGNAPGVSIIKVSFYNQSGVMFGQNLVDTSGSDVTKFAGFTVSNESPIYSMTLDYGDTTLSESIDDLMFVPALTAVSYDASAKPVITAPANSQVLTDYPRVTRIAWTEIGNASKYNVEVACDVCLYPEWTSIKKWDSVTSYTQSPALAGDNLFRARVKAVYPDGTTSQWSDYVYFRYNTSVNNNECNAYCQSHTGTEGVCNGTEGEQVGSKYCNLQSQCVCKPKTCATDQQCTASNPHQRCINSKCVFPSCDYACKNIYGYSAGGTCGSANGHDVGSVYCGLTLKQCMCAGAAQANICENGACEAPITPVSLADIGLYGFVQIGKYQKQVKWNETITLTPEDTINGDKSPYFNVNYSIKNYGAATAKTFVNTIYVDQVMKYPHNYTYGLGQNDVNNINANVNIGSKTGVHTIRFSVDGGGHVAESKDTNNEGYVYVKLEGFDNPDYDVNIKPVITRPYSNEVYTNYPRRAQLNWTSVKNAKRYDVQVACDTCGPSDWASVNSYTSYSTSFLTPALAGDNQFRVRVRAVYANGAMTDWSEYVYFRYKTSTSKKTACYNQTGSDGVYTLCVGKYLNHSTGFKVTNVKQNSQYIWVKTSWNNTTNNKTYKIKLGNTRSFDMPHSDTMVDVTYLKYSSTKGATLRLETDYDTDTEVITAPSSQEAPATASGNTVEFEVAVNDYTSHPGDYNSKNLELAHLNMYTVKLDTVLNKFVYAGEDRRQTSTSSNPYATFSVAPGQMVYFEGFRTSDAAIKASSVAKTRTFIAPPPYKNFGNKADTLCQTNWTDINSIMKISSDGSESCAISLSTPYQD